MEKLLDDVWIAEAVHQDDADAMAGMCALERRHILQFDGEADHFQTAFAIALWPEQKEVGTAQEGKWWRLSHVTGVGSGCHRGATTALTGMVQWDCRHLGITQDRRSSQMCACSFAERSVL